MHAGISAGYIWIILKLFNFNLPVSNYLLEQVDKLARLDFSNALADTLKVALAITIGLVFCVMLLMLRNSTVKR
jgi:hypothetical protein